jgi:hypothetical protein
LNFESFCTYLEAVHGLYGGLGRRSVVVRHEAEALGEIGLFVYEHFSRDHVAEWQERGRQVRVRELLRQVVNEQVTALWTCGTKYINLLLDCINHQPYVPPDSVEQNDSIFV